MTYTVSSGTLNSSIPYHTTNRKSEVPDHVTFDDFDDSER